MTFIIILLAITAIVTLWTMWARPWLKRQSWAAGFFAWIEPIERGLWAKSETILWARFLQVTGLVTTVLGIFGTIDWTVITPLVPDTYQKFMPLIPLILNLIGTVTEKLRRDTTEPLAVVSAPEAVKAALPEVAAMKDAKEAAVAAVEEAKAEGTA